MKMRELKHVSNELELIGLDLELESEDVAAAEAAVAAVTAESQGRISCSCCNELLETVELLHLHQTERHTLADLSLALLTLRGLDLPLAHGSIEEDEKFPGEPGLNRLLLDTVEKRLCDSDGESTITVDSEARMATLNNSSPPHWAFSSPFGLQSKSQASSRLNGMAPSMITPSYNWSNMYPSLGCGDDAYQYKNYPSDSFSLTCTKEEIIDDSPFWSDVNGNDVSHNVFMDGEPPDSKSMVFQELLAARNYSRDLYNTQKSKVTAQSFYSDQKMQNSEMSNYHSNFDSQEDKVFSTQRVNVKNESDPTNGVRKPSSLYKHLSSVRKVKRHVRFQEDETSPVLKLRCFPDLPEGLLPTCNASPYKEASRTDSSHSRKDARNFFCDTCGRGYKKKSHLERHLRVHTGVRPYPCTMCDKRFAVRSILNQHLRVHTGERPYSCSICMQRFPQKSGLMTHMMLHTGKPFKCEFCVKSFVSNHKLVSHKRSSHNHCQENANVVGPYHCLNCDMRFFTSGALTEHRKIHYNEFKDCAGGKIKVESSNDSGVYCSKMCDGDVDHEETVSVHGSVKMEEPVTITEEAAIAAVSVVSELSRGIKPTKRRLWWKEELSDDPLKNSKLSVNSPSYFLLANDGFVGSDVISSQDFLNEIKSEPLISILDG